MSHTANSIVQKINSQYILEKSSETYAYCHSHGETASRVRDPILLRWECSLCHPQAAPLTEN